MRKLRLDGKSGRSGLMFVAASLIAVTAQAATPRAPTLCLDDQAGCAAPPAAGSYPWYPSLNLSAIPWHNASGAWGPRVAIEAPAAPVTTRSVNVTSASQFNSAAGVAGTRITVTSGWAQNSVVTINANNIDVIIPPGVTVGAIEIGAWPRTTPLSRIRIRGTTPGTHSGGLMGQYRDFAMASDIIIDGIDINGASGFGPGETNQAFRASGTRLAVLNSRVIAGAYTWLGSAKHVVIANSNFYHGAASRDAVGIVEGWGIRNTGGPITIVDSRIQGTRYHNLRAQSVGGSGELLYVTRSTFVAQAEGRTAWLWNNLNAGPYIGQGAILEGNSIYTYAQPGCGFGGEISVNNVSYSVGRNNRFYGGGSAVLSLTTLLNLALGGAPGSHDWSNGNTFAPLVSFPAWTGPGDPTQVPLPNGLALIRGEGSCPGMN
jgi:hypothetical protein